MNKKIVYLLIIMSIGLFISACGKDKVNVGENPVVIDIPKNFEECAAKGNPIMESYPRQCKDGENTFFEKMKLNETPELTGCSKIYQPVCGEIEVQCIKAPCPPIKTTFSNKCEAEKNGAKNIVDGECKDEDINLEGACLSFDGNWLAESKECEGMGKEQCENLGGEFNECASACRNNPEAEVCTMQCVIVCKFK